LNQLFKYLIIITYIMTIKYICDHCKKEINITSAWYLILIKILGKNEMYELREFHYCKQECLMLEINNLLLLYQNIEIKRK